jgi:hypothetical protein
MPRATAVRRKRRREEARSRRAVTEGLECFATSGILKALLGVFALDLCRARRRRKVNRVGDEGTNDGEDARAHGKGQHDDPQIRPQLAQ